MTFHGEGSTEFIIDIAARYCLHFRTLAHAELYDSTNYTVMYMKMYKFWNYTGPLENDYVSLGGGGGVGGI